MADINFSDSENDDLAAARWVLAIEAGLDPAEIEAFHAWLAAGGDRAELIARQAMMQDLAKQAGGQKLADRTTPPAMKQAQLRASTSRRNVLAGGLIVASAAALGAVALTFGAPAPAPAIVDQYQTATGEVRSVSLADNSQVWLDTRTSISVSLTPERRDVTLKAGRLFVEVAPDAKRPFTVHGTAFEARAFGTSFEAAVLGGRTGVAVAEGIVRLIPAGGGPTIDLAAGQCAWISALGEISRTNASVRSIAAWRDLRIVVSDRRLDAVLLELSRYFDRPLTVADQQLAARRVSLSFSILDLSGEEAARIIAGAVGADVADRAGAGLELRPAALPR